MWKEYSLPFGADGFAARGHTRPGIPLSRAKAKGFSELRTERSNQVACTIVCAPTGEGTFIKQGFTTAL